MAARLFLPSFLSWLVWIPPLFYVVYTQSPACSTHQISYPCDASPFCHYDDTCTCTSDAPLDILFMIAASQNSFPLSADFEQNLQWIEKVVTQDVSSQSRIGISTFDITVDEAAPIQYWNSSDLVQRIQTLPYPMFGGTPSTSAASAVVSAMDQFARLDDRDREKLFILQTGFNPCDGDSCPYSICQYQSVLQEAGIHTAIIGVGTNLEPEYVECAADYYVYSTSYADLYSNGSIGLIDRLCPNTSISDITTLTVASGVTPLDPYLIWTDDFQYNADNAVNNSNLGINWYSSTAMESRWGRNVASNALGPLHGWYAKCNADPCYGSQINREFACNPYEDVADYLVTISFDAYVACPNAQDTGLLYSRYTHSAGSYLAKQIDVATTGEAVTDKSDKRPSGCTESRNVWHIPVLDTFNVNHSDIISIAIWVEMDRMEEAIAFGGFEVQCDPITTNPTEAPTQDPSYTPTIKPSSHPSVNPTAIPTMLPTKHPTDAPSEPTIIPTQATYGPTVHPTAQTSFPSSPPTHQTVNPSAPPTGIPTAGPTAHVTTQAPTENPTQYYGWLWFICYYDDYDVYYYGASIEISKYAQIMVQQIVDTIGEMEANSQWKPGGIHAFNMCKVFTAQTIDTDCPSYEVDREDHNDDAEYVAIGRFDLVAAEDIESYTEHITDILEGDTFKNKFNLNMNTALNAVMNDTRRRRRRTLSQSAFSAELIQIVDAQWTPSTTAAELADSPDSKGEEPLFDRMVETALAFKYELFIGVGAATILCCVCVIAFFCCRQKKNEPQNPQEVIQNKTLIQMHGVANPRPMVKRQEFESITPVATPNAPPSPAVPATTTQKLKKAKSQSMPLKVTPMGIEMEQVDKATNDKRNEEKKEATADADAKKGDLSPSAGPDLPDEIDELIHGKLLMTNHLNALNVVANTVSDPNIIQNIRNAAEQAAEEVERKEKESIPGPPPEPVPGPPPPQEPTPPAPLPPRSKNRDDSDSDSLDVLQHKYLSDEINEAEDEEDILILGSGYVTKGGPDGEEPVSEN